MGALTATKVKKTEFAGDLNVQVFTVTPTANGDTVDLSSYFSTIYAVIPHLTAGIDANLAFVNASFLGTTVTLSELKPDAATPASDWTGASITLVVIGESIGV